MNLSRLFTTARATLPLRYLDDPAHASAYLSYFFPVNLSKVQGLLDELSEDIGMEASDHPTNVLDLGCGPGTGALALLDWLWHRNPERAKSVSVLASDATNAPLREAKKLWEAYCQEVGISSNGLRCVEGNLEHPLKGDLGKQIVRGGPYDLMIMANCLNELFPASTRSLPRFPFPVLRAISRFLRQIRIAFSQDYMWTTLRKHPAIAAAIVLLFHVRFDTLTLLMRQCHCRAAPLQLSTPRAARRGLSCLRPSRRLVS